MEWLSCDNERNGGRRLTRVNIGVIGGGLSGLIAAYTLQKKFNENGKVTVLEKDARVGGRIFSKKFQNCPIELGAQFFIDGGEVQNLIKRLKLESSVIPLKKNFLSFYYNKKIFIRDDLVKDEVFKTKQEKEEKEHLFGYFKQITFTSDLIIPSFEHWYRKNIGEQLLPFWNRFLISIGVRDAQSVNAYFGLILLNVLFGENLLFSTGLNHLTKRLSEEIVSMGGAIITNANCSNIEHKEGNFHVTVNKNDVTKDEMVFQKIISAVPPNELSKFLKLNISDFLLKIDSHPMNLSVITSPEKLWDVTWGLIICENESPIYALCDWRNISNASKDTPLLAICDPSVSSDDVIAYLKKLFPLNQAEYKIIFEKKWTIGLHQPNETLYKIQKDIMNNVPSNFYVAGDWMVLPALEGAVISGVRAATSLIKNL